MCPHNASLPSPQIEALLEHGLERLQLRVDVVVVRDVEPLQERAHRQRVVPMPKASHLFIYFTFIDPQGASHGELNQGLTLIARHVTQCHSTQETRVQIALVVASAPGQAAPVARRAIIEEAALTTDEAVVPHLEVVHPRGPGHHLGERRAVL